MTEKEKMLSGQYYNALDKELKRLYQKNKVLLKKYNKTLPNQTKKRYRLLKRIFGSIGDKACIQPNIFFDYGINTYVGDNFYANAGLVILDVAKVTIGNNVMLGPNVHIYTASHPLNSEERNAGYEFGKEISIGNNTWIGGGSIINPGVVIGNNVVIGSGSVVTKDIEDNVVAAGNPCRVIKKI